MSSRRDRIRAKIMERVVITPGPLPTPCHIWTGPTSGDGYEPGGSKKGRGHGYPRMHLDGQTVAVHKVSWTNEHGFIPGKKQLDHLCENRRCVNDEHPELVTHLKNQRRRARAAVRRKREAEQTEMGAGA